MLLHYNVNINGIDYAVDMKNEKCGTIKEINLFGAKEIFKGGITEIKKFLNKIQYSPINKSLF